MLDVRPTQYISPLDEEPLGYITPIVHVENLADEFANVTGLFRIYRKSTGQMVWSSPLTPTSISGYNHADIEASTPFLPGEVAAGDYFIICDTTAVNPIWGHVDNEGLGEFWFDIVPAPPPPPPATLEDVIVTLETRASEETVDNLLHLMPLDPSTETTLQDILTKLPLDPATEAGQLAIIAQLQQDPPTESTLLAILTQLQLDPPTETTLQSIHDKLPVSPPAGLNPRGWLEVGTSQPLKLVFAGRTRAILVQADPANTALVFVGGEELVPYGSQCLCCLQPGDSIVIELDDALEQDVYVVAETAGQHIFHGATIDP